MRVEEAIQICKKGTIDIDQFIEAQDTISNNIDEFNRIIYPEVFRRADNGTTFKIWLPMENRDVIMAKDGIESKEVIILNKKEE